MFGGASMMKPDASGRVRIATTPGTAIGPPTAGAAGLSHVAKKDRPDAPAINPNAPSAVNATSVAGTGSGIDFCSGAWVEKTKRFEPLLATMNAFRLSGEKAAAIAPDTGRAVWAPLVTFKMNTWLKAACVSEMMTEVPSGERASTLPVIVAELAAVG